MTNLYDKIENLCFMIKYQLEMDKKSIYENTKFSNRLKKMIEYCVVLEKELNLSNNEIIRLIKMKNIFEEMKNIFEEVSLLKEIFTKLYNVINKNCLHKYEYDYIDLDLDTSVKIKYCNMCYCTHK